MQSLPEIPAQDFFFGLTSAGLLLWTLLYLAKPRELDPRRRSEVGRAGGDELFTRIPFDRPSNQFPFLGSLFAHLFLVALVPWIQLMYPDSLPFNLDQYDLVVVQFKVQEPPLSLPPELARRNRERERSEPNIKNPNARPDTVEDPGLGNREEAPKTETDPGGEGREPDIAVRQRYEIVLPERPRPRPAALAQAVGADVEMQLPMIAPGARKTDIAWQFDTPDPSTIPMPGVALAELDVASPELTAELGVPTNMPDLGQPRVLTPALSEVADVPTLGELGQEGWGALLRGGGEGDGNAMELAQALQGSPFGAFFGGGAGTGSGQGAGDASDDGASGQGGEGFGTGFLGQGPVPRSLHGIIVISNEVGAIPEAATVLTGNPVYTVYLEAPGFTKKWVLQVCIPARRRDEVEFGGEVIRVYTRKTLDPPYAFQKASLDLDLSGRSELELPPRVVIYGRFDETGALGDLRVIAGLDPQTDRQVMASLKAWEFAPAFRDGEPVAVEAVFGIPLR